MEHITDVIRSRRSVRTYNGKEIDAALLEKLMSYASTIENPYKMNIEYKLLKAGEHGLSCPVAKGTDLFIGGKIKKGIEANLAFGYSFEMLILYAQSLGIGTVWLGGTMNRSAFEKAMELGEDEFMPCASALGLTAEKMSVKEGIMRKAIKADERRPFEELFFLDDFSAPLTSENAGRFSHLLEMVRLAPSAVNRQPWRVLVRDNAAHFYLKRTKGFSVGELDMQMVDMGIALCHFDLAAREANLKVTFAINDPKIETNCEYIASYLIEE